MAWLLDTNAWIYYLKNPASAVRANLSKHTPDEILTCAVVKAELLVGALKYGVPERRLAIVKETLAPFLSLPFDDACADKDRLLGGAESNPTFVFHLASEP